MAASDEEVTAWPDQMRRDSSKVSSLQILTLSRDSNSVQSEHDSHPLV